jgi:hypothetical protein
MNETIQTISSNAGQGREDTTIEGGNKKKTGSLHSHPRSTTSFLFGVEEVESGMKGIEGSPTYSPGDDGKPLLFEGRS